MKWNYGFSDFLSFPLLFEAPSLVWEKTALELDLRGMGFIRMCLSSSHNSYYLLGILQVPGS